MPLLPWLLPPPADFNAQCADLREADDPLAQACLLARYALNVNQCNRLVRTLAKIRSGDPARSASRVALSPFRLGVVSNATFDLVVPALQVTGLRLGLDLEVIGADFDQVAQEAFDPGSTLNRARPDAVLLALDYRALPFASGAYARCTDGFDSTAGIEYLDGVRKAFASHSGAPCIVQTLAQPPVGLAGGLDCQVAGMVNHEIDRFNVALRADVAASSDALADIASVASWHGTGCWFDDRQWFMSRIAMANEMVPVYAEHVVRVVAAMRGKSHKCLVLDLDNTLWGGVIGDDGLDGIAIGQGNARGEAHLALQRYAKDLKQLGIILAVCSKNEDAVARQPFVEHPDMLLELDDFAVFVANWNDKAGNLRDIANTLNIGLDALVFVDDNPAERDIVRSLVPEVSVPELPSDPALVPRTLAAAGYFEMLSFTAEDAQRAEQYAANAQRELAQKALEAGGNEDGIGDFLASLQMCMSCSAFDRVGRKRITQLINKTNQFNLTTRRYTEAEVESLEASAEHFTLQVRHVDRFGDNGMISVVICKMHDETWEIDTWLMSCRVIKRRVEEAVCDELVRHARQAGATRLRGLYAPTQRNVLVKDHYVNLGFAPVDVDGETEVFELTLADYAAFDPPIEIERAAPAGTTVPASTAARA